ncbi:hypothetical protein AJ85_10580 [Alkalihalobacillus alcalophilus ATCC 27647 = CGMCC 1.3604]|uniref:RNA polymerase sigma-70 region 2 domain-containing protein n=1 Tax=Alkalihalobacillus alcalophilus ATCC 27647 = CGMCC 1.3604 TaxID=1218173 RepID=A0A094YYM2_ALKAL|nr:sigma-70 family RNA polymerase sigma factor [Alkalihalobacillus alcalophilus]KGA98642.1 hypothetical protein BALCAV_0203190 [Alkalihalobacillus alcalophilus ATCC 27647 = CGMCC 1.3604]THG88301.1 hypothetical protein AJ85_10580 [Alkalihalobacillus alcalophilus ATCC 27647 = CGMCC 1.3604]
MLYQDSFQSVLEDFQPLIKGQIKKLLIYKNFDEYYQIAQISLWKAYEHYDPTKGHFAAYALQRVRGDLIDQLRKEHKYEERYELVDHQTEQTIQLSTTNVEATEDFLTPYYHLLSNREQTWLTETIYQDMKLSEIATKYGVSKNTVSSWRKSTLKKLRMILVNEES